MRPVVAAHRALPLNDGAAVQFVGDDGGNDPPLAALPSGSSPALNLRNLGSPVLPHRSGDY
ncbi:MAG: hypothetical protein HUU41_23030 [Bryobacteraceae bacterium]|nr:hypothetical protein [Bryobacteraceae bacterium]